MDYSFPRSYPVADLSTAAQRQAQVQPDSHVRRLSQSGSLLSLKLESDEGHDVQYANGNQSHPVDGPVTTTTNRRSLSESFESFPEVDSESVSLSTPKNLETVTVTNPAAAADGTSSTAVPGHEIQNKSLPKEREHCQVY